MIPSEMLLNSDVDVFSGDKTVYKIGIIRETIFISYIIIRDIISKYDAMGK